MPTYTQAERPLSITTPLGPDALLLVGVDGKETLSELFRFDLELLAENGLDVPFEKLLGQKVVARIRLSEQNTRYMGGVVSRVAQGSRDEVFTTYRMELVPQLWFLTKRKQSRIFQALSVPEILKKVFTGLDVAYEVQGTFYPREYCAQYRESDFAFASRLMEEEGIYYFFRHTAAGSTLVLGNTPQSHPDANPGRVVYEEIAGGNRPDERVYSWEKTQELRSGKVTLWDQSFELPNKNLEAQKTIADTVSVGTVTHKLKTGGNDKLELYDFPGGYANHFDGIDRGGGERPADLQKIFEDNTRTADVRIHEEAVQSISIRATSSCPQLAAGFRFTLDRHFNADGTYVLTAVEHHAKLLWDYRSAGQTTEFRYDNSFTCIPLALPFRPLRTTPTPHVQGAQTALVVGPAGEEIFTDKYGRIKVQFPWDREGKKDGDTSCWLRVATAWAGKQWGMIYIPRIGQEVLVDFVDGDVDHPVVVGSLYNADQMPPYALPANKTQSGLKSRSTLQGGAANYNEIRFEDKKGSEQILIHAEKDQTSEVENDESHWVGHDRVKKIDHDETTTIKHDQTVTVDNDRTVTITQGNDSLTISMGNSKTSISVGKSETEALQSIELKVGSSSVKLDQSGVTITGLNVQIDGKVMTSVKGLTTQVNAETMLTLKGALTTIN
jgi:type VI secretion system secreted protein VgrG